MTANATVAANPVQGRSSAKGAAPKIDPKITARRPNRSVIGPPKSVPTAPAAKKAKRTYCAPAIVTPNFSIT